MACGLVNKNQVSACAMNLYIESAYVKDMQVRFRRLAPFGRIVQEAVFGKQ